MSFLTLTSADDGRPLNVRAAHIQAIAALDHQTTQVFLAGGGEILVRETRTQVRDLVDLVDHRSANETHRHLPSLRSW